MYNKQVMLIMTKYKKPFLIILGTIVFQSILYMLARLIQGNPHIIGEVMDSKIPFIIYFIVPYCLWYFLIFIIPMIYYKSDKNLFTKYILCFLLCSMISNVIFIIYPTAVLRPKIISNGFFDNMADIVFGIDNPPINCFPSLHCAISLALILYTFEDKKCTIGGKIAIIIISLSIMAGTLFVKQHVFIDVIGGCLLCIIVFLIIERTPKLVSKTKKLLKLE